MSMLMGNLRVQISNRKSFFVDINWGTWIIIFIFASVVAILATPIG
jgi:hypothetical protein